VVCPLLRRGLLACDLCVALALFGEDAANEMEDLAISRANVP
jgi:hypothetical protein